jgi:hypothetical protein
VPSTAHLPRLTVAKPAAARRTTNTIKPTSSAADSPNDSGLPKVEAVSPRAYRRARECLKRNPTVLSQSQTKDLAEDRSGLARNCIAKSCYGMESAAAVAQVQYQPGLRGGLE